MKAPEYSDILFSYPSYDDDAETWYVRHVWAYYRGKRVTFSECDSGGNHEPLYAREEKKLSKETQGLWRDYSAWVIENNGDDPCGEFMVKRSKKVKRNVVVHFTKWIGSSEHGLAVTSIRTARGLQNPQDLPDGMQEYLCLKKIGDRYVMDGINEEHLKDNVGYLGKNYFKATAEWNEPVSKEKIRRETMRLARKHLSRKEGK